MEPCPYCHNCHGELTVCYEMAQAFKKAGDTLWLHPLQTTWQVYRYGVPVSDVMEDDYDCFSWLIQNQPHSIDTAIKHHGYELRQHTTERGDER